MSGVHPLRRSSAALAAAAAGLLLSASPAAALTTKPATDLVYGDAYTVAGGTAATANRALAVDAGGAVLTASGTVSSVVLPKPWQAVGLAGATLGNP